MTAQSRQPLLLLTRPEAQARRFLAELPQDVVAGVAPQIAPLLRIVLRPIGSLDALSGLILTSENAVRALGHHDVAGLPAYCVGTQTAKTAKSLGMQVQVFGTNADDLVAGLIDLAPPGRLVHLHGAVTRGAVAERLQHAGLSVEARLAYAQEPQGLPDDLVRALRRDRRAIAPLFSPRTARLFAAQCQKALQTDVICLSHAVAAELNTMCYRSVQTCDAATGDAMATAVTRAVTGRPLEGACRSG